MRSSRLSARLRPNRRHDCPPAREDVDDIGHADHQTGVQKTRASPSSGTRFSGIAELKDSWDQKPGRAEALLVARDSGNGQIAVYGQTSVHHGALPSSWMPFVVITSSILCAGVLVYRSWNLLQTDNSDKHQLARVLQWSRRQLSFRSCTCRLRIIPLSARGVLAVRQAQTQEPCYPLLGVFSRTFCMLFVNHWTPLGVATQEHNGICAQTSHRLSMRSQPRWH